MGQQAIPWLAMAVKATTGRAVVVEEEDYSIGVSPLPPLELIFRANC